MLNYTTTTIVNDPTSIVTNKSGLVKANGFKGTKFYVKYGPMLYCDDDHTVKLLKKTAGQTAQLAKATITLTDLTATKWYRLLIYVRLRNNNSSLYSNSWTFKGKPFAVEFKGNKTVTAIAELIEKTCIFEYGTKLITAKVSEGKLVLEATDLWQVFVDLDGNKSVIALVLEPVGTSANPAFSYISGENGEVWTDTEAVTVEVDNGHEAFGDFAHIIKDLRLPTAANWRWEGVASAAENDDKPQPNILYTQYTILYDSERGIQLQSALGGLAKSRTTHVFFVAPAAVDAFDAALNSVIPSAVSTAEVDDEENA